MGPVVVEAAGIDRATGSSTSPPAPATPRSPQRWRGVVVTASDLTPELLEAGRAAAAAAGAQLEWRQADAEALPFDDASFDVVTSVVGVMFAPHHQARRTSWSACAGRAAGSRCSPGRRRASSARCSR